MAKLVRMTSAEYRAWNQNEPQLVTKEGVPVQALTKAQEVECAKVMALARRKESTVSKEVVIKDLDPETGKHRTSPKKITIEAKVMRTGPGTGEIQVFAFLDGLMRVTTRDIITARMFKAHGECQLVRPNGKFLKKIRDPQRTPQKSPTQIANIQQFQVPSPSNCECRSWGAPHPGRHYPHCKFNDLAPPEQRGLKPGEDENGRVITNSEAKKRAVEKPALLISPDECKCKEWERTDPSKHANICEHKEAWEAQGKPVYYLTEMGGKVLRKATADEVLEGEQVRASTGQAILTVDGTVCILLSEKELQAAPATSSVEVVSEKPLSGDSLSLIRPENLTAREMTGEVEPYQPRPEETAIGGGDIDKGGLPLAGISL